METIKEYEVEVTSKAKLHYFEILEYFYEHLSYESATRKSEDLYNSIHSLRNLPERGHPELILQHLNKGHRYLLYQSTSRTSIKVIYFVDKKSDVVYVTDFFPTEMDEKKIKDRND